MIKCPNYEAGLFELCTIVETNPIRTEWDYVSYWCKRCKHDFKASEPIHTRPKHRTIRTTIYKTYTSHPYKSSDWY